MEAPNEGNWPPLPYESWKDTYATLHMWTQLVGKIALAQAVPLNHSWSIAMHVTPRGMSTRTLPYGNRTFNIQFDFIDHALVVQSSDNQRKSLALRPQTVADFYHELMATLDGMGLPVKIWTMPVEIPSPVRFELDSAHRTYDPFSANRFWRILSRTARVLAQSRCDFIGKCSPVHFFWGSFDLAVTRFSGRRAPPREGPAFMREAYSHEVISHGFWPGNDSIGPALYCYAAPEPQGFKDARVQPDATYYHRELGEFVLPYDAIRKADSPDQAVLAFVASTYERAAALAGWDRRALERTLQSS